VWEDIVANLKTHFEPKPCNHLETHFEPKPLVITERFVFNRRHARDWELVATRELVADYVAALRKLSIHCNFGASMKDRFVCWLTMRCRKSYSSRQNLPSRAIEAAQGIESAASKAKELQSHSPAEAQGQGQAVHILQHNLTTVVISVWGETTFPISASSRTNCVWNVVIEATSRLFAGQGTRGKEEEPQSLKVNMGETGKSRWSKRSQKTPTHWTLSLNSTRSKEVKLAAQCK